MIMLKKDLQSKKTKKILHKRIITDLLDTNGDAVESWRVFRIMAEFVAGFEILRKYGLAATIFGSARFRQGDPYYKLAAELS